MTDESAAAEEQPSAPPGPAPPDTTPTRPSGDAPGADDSDEEAPETELTEEDGIPEEPVVNIPLAMSFLLGGGGLVLVVVLKISRGMPILSALAWASSAFVAVTIVGFILDVLLPHYRTVIIQPIETIEEPEQPDAPEGAEDELADTATSAGDPAPPPVEPDAS